MRKTLIAVMALTASCMVLVGCQKTNNEISGNPENETPQETVRPIATRVPPEAVDPKDIVINENYDVDEGLKEATEMTRLNQIENSTTADNKIDFSDLPGVTYEYTGEVLENELTEVWIIKMSDNNQYKSIIAKIRARVEALKEEYKDNNAISHLLNDNDNIVIKQSNGVVIAVFAGDAGAIASGIEQTTYEKTE